MNSLFRNERRIRNEHSSGNEPRLQRGNEPEMNAKNELEMNDGNEPEMNP